MLPLAPGRFSTTTGFLLRSCSFCANTRARMSMPVPGVNGTISRMARLGYCACAPAAAASRSTSKIRFMKSLYRR